MNHTEKPGAMNADGPCDPWPETPELWRVRMMLKVLTETSKIDTSTIYGQARRNVIERECAKFIDSFDKRVEELRGKRQ